MGVCSQISGGDYALASIFKMHPRSSIIPTTDLSVRSSMINSLRISWTEPTSANSGNVRLSRRVTTTASNIICRILVGKVISNINKGTTTSTTGCLSVGTPLNYTVCFCALYVAGTVYEGNTVTASSGPPADSFAVRWRFTIMAPDYIGIAWEASLNTGVMGFKVAHSSTITPANYDGGTDVGTDNSAGTHTIIGVTTLNTAYKVRVCGRNAGGGVEGEELTLGASGYIGSLATGLIGTTQISLTWTEPANIASIDRFEVRTNNCSGMIRKSPSHTERSTTITGLTFNTSYTFVLCSKSVDSTHLIGTENILFESEALNAMTSATLPTMAENLQATNITSTNFTVTRDNTRRFGVNYPASGAWIEFRLCMRLNSDTSTIQDGPRIIFQIPP